jgi:hypothetical protein
MTNLTHSSFLCIYFNSLHVSSNLVLIIRRINRSNTSGICHSVLVSLVCRSERNFPTCTRNGNRQVYHMFYWYNWFSWWWARGCSKHVENWNKYTKKKCASGSSFTKHYNKMHGQQNIKYIIKMYVSLKSYMWLMFKEFCLLSNEVLGRINKQI